MHRWAPTDSMEGGWMLDGPSFELYLEPAPGRIELHQLFAATLLTYLPTTNPTEGSPNYEYDTHLGYCEIVSSETATKPLWRLYHEGLNRYLVSKDSDEISHSLTLGYDYEALLCYVP